MKGQLIMNTLLALKFDVQYKSLWPHVAIEHLRCDRSDWSCAVCIRCMWNFEGYEKECKICRS